MLLFLLICRVWVITARSYSNVVSRKCKGRIGSLPSRRCAYTFPISPQRPIKCLIFCGVIPGGTLEMNTIPGVWAFFFFLVFITDEPSDSWEDKAGLEVEVEAVALTCFSIWEPVSSTSDSLSRNRLFEDLEGVVMFEIELCPRFLILSYDLKMNIAGISTFDVFSKTFHAEAADMAGGHASELKSIGSERSLDNSPTLDRRFQSLPRHQIYGYRSG